MSKEDVQVVERAFDAFAAGGVEALLAFVSADVVWYPFPEWVEESEYRGHAGFRRVMAVWTENFDDFKVEGHGFREVGGRVLFLTWQQALEAVGLRE